MFAKKADLCYNFRILLRHIMVQISTDTEALKPILENSGDSQLSEEDRLDQQTALALEEIDKLATTNVSNVAGGLEGAFA